MTISRAHICATNIFDIYNIGSTNVCPCHEHFPVLWIFCPYFDIYNIEIKIYEHMSVIYIGKLVYNMGPRMNARLKGCMAGWQAESS